MTPVNATTPLMDEAPRAEAAAAKGVRPTAEAIELAWMLRGSQSELPGKEPPQEERTVELAAVAAPVAEPQALADGSATADDVAPPAARRDWSSALDLVQEACEAIRIAEERVQELERQGQQTAFQAREDMKALQLQILATERRAQAAEARAAKADARAQEAEAWLARLHDAIVMGFARNPAAGDDR